MRQVSLEMPGGIQMARQDTKKRDIKGGESPKKKGWIFLIRKQRKEKVNSALSSVEFKLYI